MTTLGSVTRWIDETLHPAWFHSAIARPPYFEGWYFKSVSADEGARYAIIPGVFLHDDPARQHAFVQVFDGVSGRATYHRYPADQFIMTPGAFDLRIGANHFTLGGIHLDIDDGRRRIYGDLEFGAAIPWPVSAALPGLMGPFGWLPIMECYHGVLGFDHAVSGALHDDGVTVDFAGGRGYIEKDWGRSFPAAWVWMQTNHFDAPGTSFMGSVAIVPSLGSWFPGFSAGLWHGGRLSRFTTYNRSRTTALEVDGARVRWVLQNPTEQLEIVALRAETSILPGPTPHDMNRRVPETLKAGIALTLTTRGDHRVLFEGVGRCAGLEIVGEIERLQGAIRW